MPNETKNKAVDDFIKKAVERARKKYKTRGERERALKEFFSRDEVLKRLDDLQNLAFYNFVPRPDNPEMLDQQASFCYNRDPISFLVGGNAAGTTEAAAFKTALFCLTQQPPPRPDTPFWVISDTYEQVCATCWQEKLFGHGHIPPSEIDWARVSWINKTKGWPASVPLKPWIQGTNPFQKPKGAANNWRLVFKSYSQGRAALQAQSIGGFWFSEQYPWDIFLEVLRGCREYMFPGGQFAEFTPIDPVRALEFERAVMRIPESERKTKGYAVYRANTRANEKNLAKGWFKSFTASISEEMQATRILGELATFEGIVFKTFSERVHVVDKIKIPKGAMHYRGIDWGASESHPFVCVWGCLDAIGNWIIYDEYWSIDQSALLDDHIDEIERRSKEWGWPENYSQNPLYRPIFADPSRPDNIRAFVQAGIPILPATHTGPDVYESIETVRALLKVQPSTGKPKLTIYADCKRLIDEMRMYRWKPRPLVTAPGAAAPPPMVVKDKDDTIDAMRYMVHWSKLNNVNLTPSEPQRREIRKRDWRAAFRYNEPGNEDY